MLLNTTWRWTERAASRSKCRWSERSASRETTYAKSASTASTASSRSAPTNAGRNWFWPTTLSTGSMMNHSDWCCGAPSRWLRWSSHTTRCKKCKKWKKWKKWKKFSRKCPKESRKNLEIATFWALVGFWGDFEGSLRGFWGNFEGILSEFWGNFERILREFWGNFEGILREFLREFYANFEGILASFLDISLEILKSIFGIFLDDSSLIHNNLWLSLKIIFGFLWAPTVATGGWMQLRSKKTHPKDRLGRRQGRHPQRHRRPHLPQRQNLHPAQRRQARLQPWASAGSAPVQTRTDPSDSTDDPCGFGYLFRALLVLDEAASQAPASGRAAEAESVEESRSRRAALQGNRTPGGNRVRHANGRVFRRRFTGTKTSAGLNAAAGCNRLFTFLLQSNFFVVDWNSCVGSLLNEIRIS